MTEIHGSLTHEDGPTLTVTRALPVPVEEAWEWITISDRTARWYGPWRGTGRVGETVQVTMSEEEGAPETAMRVEACERPHLLTLVADNPPPFAFPIDLVLAPTTQGCSISLRHRQIPPELPVRDLGPGWELYLDRLVAAVEERTPLTFAECVERYAEGYASLG